MRSLLFIWTAVLAAIVCVAQIESVSAFWQSRGSGYNKSIVSGGGGGFTGPGDVVSGALAWWSPYACYNSAYVGNVADVWDTATGNTTETLITCSSGGVVNETVHSLAVTCAVACNVETLYDQIGTNCSGACDLIETTNPNRPTLALSSLNGHPCVQFTGTAGVVLVTLTNISASTSQPVTYSTVAKSINNSTQQSLFGNAAQLGYNNSGANTGFLFAGSVVTFSATDAAFHAIQAVFNSASSAAVVDGSATSGNAGASAMSANFTLGGIGGTQPFDGTVCEIGVWPIAFNSTQYGNMNTNQHTRWSF